VIRGGALRPISWQSPIPSAQVKSAILLAGLSAGVPVEVTEPVPSRDHTERMFRAVGLRVSSRGTTVEFEPGATVPPSVWHVPGDPSSAAFLVAAALLGRRGAVAIRGVGVNPTRTGFLAAVSDMGGTIAREGEMEVGGEPVADLVAAPSALSAITVEAESVPAMIDEIPMLACLAARAEGTSVFHGLGELRVKESDRLALLVENLTAIGGTATTEGDTLFVTGSDRRYQGRVRTAGDHRIAMAFAVLDTHKGLRIDAPASADVSFPGFAATLAAARRMVA
jgi:3-phosphoshikimate 1-carboxyvinyltransferase